MLIAPHSTENTTMTKLGINMSKKSNDDEYYTPNAAIEMLNSALIKSRFPPNKKKINKIYKTSPKSRKKVVVWECFGCDFDYIESPKYIKHMGYNVVANGEDFWTSNYGSFVISNPPYHTPRGERNMKERIIERLCELNKPFCLLMPTTYLQTKSFKRMVDKYGKFQMVMPSTKIQFYQVNPDTHEKKTKGNCSFYTCWYCWNMGFENDFNMV